MSLIFINSTIDSHMCLSEHQQTLFFFKQKFKKNKYWYFFCKLKLFKISKLLRNIPLKKKNF
jgi:hypothetical protein